MQNIEQSRIQLSQAARRLVDAARGDISAADVAAAAALPLASIAQAYGDFDTLLCELLGQMYDETRDLIARMTLNMPAGPIGRESSRERVLTEVSVSVVDGSLKKKKKEIVKD